MERQREPRMACYQRARLTLLNQDRRSIDCFAVRLSGCAMRIVASEPLPLNAAVAIDLGGWIALGDTCYIEREYSHYAVGLDLDEFVIAADREQPDETGAAQTLSLAANVTEQPVAELRSSSGIRRNY